MEKNYYIDIPNGQIQYNPITNIECSLCGESIFFIGKSMQRVSDEKRVILLTEIRCKKDHIIPVFFRVLSEDMTNEKINTILNRIIDTIPIGRLLRRRNIDENM